MLSESTRPLALWHSAWLGHETSLAWRDPHSGNRRAGFTDDGVQLPGTLIDADALTTARATIAHIAAHKMFGGPRFTVGSLKPIQIALVSLIEDARVEWLAMRARPGLRHLWAPFHLPEATRSDLPGLLQRFAASLFHPMNPNPHPWVEKGRRLFVERVLKAGDADACRAIGSLLGNDLGQMRLQFNWKSYVVEPAYRDDNEGLWDFESAPPEESTELTALAPEAGGHDQGPPPEASSDATVRAGQQGTAAIEAATPCEQRLPEWDYRPAIYRARWVTLREELVPEDDAGALLHTLEAQRPRINQLTRLLGNLRARQWQRLKRLFEGDSLDLDACIAGYIDRRTGQPFDARVYSALAQPRRDLALGLLLDVSQSTASAHGDTTVLGMECAAGALLAQALAALGDRFAMMAFRSCGRDDLRIGTVKSFAEPWDAAALRRLAGLRPGLSTRLGAALRAAALQLETQDTQRRLLFVLSDGEPSDIDCPDPRYLREDARQAVLELRHSGIDVFCFGLDVAAREELEFIFGRGRAVQVERLEYLDDYLRHWYARLTR